MNRMERYLQPALTALLIAIGTGVGITIWDGAKQLVRLEERLKGAQLQLGELTRVMQHMYSDAEAEKDFAAERRLREGAEDALRERVRAIEAGATKPDTRGWVPR